MQALLNLHIISVQQISFKLADITPVTMAIIVVIIINTTKDYCLQLHVIQLNFMNLRNLTLYCLATNLHFCADMFNRFNNSSGFSWTFMHKLCPC